MRPLTEPDYDEEWDDEPIPVIPVRKGLQVWVRLILIMWLRARLGLPEKDEKIIVEEGIKWVEARRRSESEEQRAGSRQELPPGAPTDPCLPN